MPQVFADDNISDVDSEREVERRVEGEVKELVDKFFGIMFWPLVILFFVWVGILGSVTRDTLSAIVGGILLTILSYYAAKQFYVEPKVQKLKEQRRIHQTQYKRDEAASLSTQLNELFVSCREHPMKASEYLKNASGWLQIAGDEYAENAFDPFWTAIENAAVNIDAFNQTVNTLSSNTRNYYAHLEGRNHTFPVFPVRPESLPDPRPVVKEFRRVVRMGQTNFQFANIWEHRKTREVLIAGFRTLGDAVNNLASVVEGEISSLRDTLHSDLVQVVEQQIRTREAAEKSVEEQAKTRQEVEKLKRK